MNSLDRLDNKDGIVESKGSPSSFVDRKRDQLRHKLLLVLERGGEEEIGSLVSRETIESADNFALFWINAGRRRGKIENKADRFLHDVKG